MTPQEFAGLGLDVVTEFAVGFKKDPNGVTLVLRHQSLPDALREQQPTTTAVLLTFVQADELSALLAQKRHEAEPQRRPDA